MSKPTPLVLLLLAAGITSASAMSLGPPADSASVGRPLDVRFPIQGDAQALSGSLCLAVDVRYGDDQVADSTAILEGSGGDVRFVRVRTTSPVNEPIISVRLRAGCEQALSRTYTLLAGAPLQTALAPSLPSLGTATSSRPPTRSASSEPGAPRASSAQSTGRAVAPSRSAALSSAAPTPARPRSAGSPPRADTGAGLRSAQGPVASNAAPNRSPTQPILQLDDPAYFRSSPATSKPAEANLDRPAAPADIPVSPPDAARPGGGTPDSGATPAAPTAAAPEDQMALMRAELAAARTEIARLQTEVTARNAAPVPNTTDHRTYLIAFLIALLVAVAAAWALHRNQKRKAEAGAWWHGSHSSMQAPDPSQAGFASETASRIDLGHGAAHDLAYPVSMLPEDLDRASMFPDFVRQDARATLAPHDDAGATLPGEPPEDRPAPARTPFPAMAAADEVVERPPVSPAPVAPQPAALPDFAASAAASYQPAAPRYYDLDLDLDVEEATAAPAPVAPVPAPAGHARLDEGNLIDFESSELGGFLKPSSRERQD